MHMGSRFVATASGALLLILAACSEESEMISSGPPDPQAAELAKAKPVELPPSIVSSQAFRCKDNSLVYVDFMSDQKTIHFRTTKGGDPITLTAPEPGQPYTGNGYTVSGGGNQISLSAPGKGTQTCSA